MPSDAGHLVYKLLLDQSAFKRGLNQAEAAAVRGGRDTGQKFSDSFVKTDISLKNPLARAFQGAEGQVKAGTTKLGSIMTGVFQGIGQQLTGILTNAVTSGLGALQGLAGKVIQVGSDAENLQIAFRAILQDANKADKLLADIRTFSAATPFTGIQVQNAAQKLLTTVNPEDMLATLRRLGEVTSGTKADLGEMALIYSQVLSKGKFQAEEMIQFAERGVPIQKALAKVLGVQVSEVSKLGSEGKITGKAMVAAFAAMADSGGQFNGIMEKQSKTFSGLASTMQDGFEASLKTVYDKLNPALVAMLGSLDSASKAAGKNSNALDVVGKAALNVEKFLKRHQPAIDAAAAAMGKMVSGAMTEALKTAEGIYDWLQKNPEVLKASSDVIQSMYSGLKLFWSIAKLLAPTFGALLKGLSAIVSVITQMVNGLQKFLDLTVKAVDATGLLSNPLANAEGSSGSAVDGGKFEVRSPDGRRTTTLANAQSHHSPAKYANHPRGMPLDLNLFQNGKSNVPVPSPVSGVVSQVMKTATSGGYGNGVVIRTPDGDVLLGHFASTAVKQGQQVVRGQTLGIQGTTGKSTGVHLHIEARKKVLEDYVRSLNTGNWGVSKNQTVALKNNPANIEGFLDAIAEGESNGGKDRSVSSAGARGIYQFIPSTRNYIKNKYGTDAWSESDQIQKAAAVNLIKDVSPQAYNAIIRGDFATAARLLNKTWTSLPGGAEESNKWKQYSLEQYKPGGSRYDLGSGGGDPNAVRSQAVKDGLLIDDSDSKKTEEAKKKAEAAKKKAADAIKKKAEAAKKKADMDIKEAEAKIPKAFSSKPKDKFEEEFRKEWTRNNLYEETPDDKYAEDLANKRKEAAEAAQKVTEEQQELLNDQKQLNIEKGEKIAEAIADLRDSEETANNKIFAEIDRKNSNSREFVAYLQREKQAKYDKQDTAFEVQTSIFSSDISARTARAQRERDPEKRRAANISVGQDSIRLELAGQLQTIEQLGRTGNYTASQLETMKENAQGLASVRMEELNDQFLTLGQTIQQTAGQAFGTFLQDVITGNKSISDSLGDMLRNLAGSFAQMGIQRLIGGLFGGGISAFAEGTEGGGKRFANLGQAMKYERFASGRRPQLAVINEGEMVLTSRQADALRMGFSPINAFSGGSIGTMKFSGGGTSVNVGDIVIGASIQEGQEEKLKGMIKSAVYGVVHKEMGQGGILRR